MQHAHESNCIQLKKHDMQKSYQQTHNIPLEAQVMLSDTSFGQLEKTANFLRRFHVELVRKKKEQLAVASASCRS